MYTGSNIVTDGLVFGYDSYYGGIQGAPTRFYKGQPTTNVLPNPERNGRFTTSNNWSSYNTNQYNGNNDFDIGTIGSVSNNIVTLSSVGHVIRSFDVLNPASTGGGVTAGTNYVVKKISSTTFSLHAYNNSQDGSQGYINPSTNFYKVHDAYANDTRVSINATNFPDMWHGSPHLPNSGLIKEVVPNGGYVKGTNCMRLHVYRGDGVADGMSYGVNTPVTQGDVVTVSYWVKPTNANAYGKIWNYQTWFGSGNANSSFNTTLNSTGDWQHVVHQWTASTTTSFISYWFPSSSSDEYAFDIADVQVELNKGHATPFVAGTRSATDSLIDLKRTTDTTVAYMSFDSTGQPEFDGTDDYVDLGSDITISPINQGWTAEYVFNSDSASTLQHFNSAEADSENSNWLALFQSYLQVWDHGQNVWRKGSTVFSSNTWYHVAFVQLDGDSMQFYVNGVAEGGDHVSFTWTAARSALITRYIGRYEYNNSYGRYFNGHIPIARLYDAPLTAAQIKQNYKAYKNRFNI